MFVKIVKRPAGDNPEWVRDAWIGLTLPILFNAPQTLNAVTLEQAAAGEMPRFRDVLRGDGLKTGYVVPIRAAVEILAQSRPDAAEWFRANAGPLIKNRGALLFDVEACEPINRTTGGALWISERYKRFFPASPGRIVGIWTAAALVCIANAICFPSIDGGYHPVLDTLYLSGTAVFAGFVAASILRLKSSSLHLLSALALLDLAMGLLSFFAKLILSPAYDATIDGALAIIYLAGIPMLIEAGFRGLRSPRRRAAAMLAAILVNVGASALFGLSYQFWRLSGEVRPLIGRAPVEEPEDNAPEITSDLLWEAQRGLVDHQIDLLHPRTASLSNVYMIAIAASGVQDLFGREAHAANAAAFSHFGKVGRGSVTLSNAAADEMHSPLATRANIAAVANAIGAKIDKTRDVVFVYLVSHGSKSAELSSDLPNYQSVQPISSKSTAQALNDAQISRRVVVVSACYAATWIPALANDNTIVIAAAARDRTSFGCDDSRNITVFGEAFLSSLRSKSISLRDAFDETTRKVAAEERKMKVTPSEPKVFIGRNMQAFWLAHGD